MKCYPLIFSRTKNDDFVPDFLVRPSGLNYNKALRFVEKAIKNVDSLDEIRYTVFSVDDFCICGGIACLSKMIIDKLQTSGAASKGVIDEAKDYLTDCKGRYIACFIGLAIPKPKEKGLYIPDISLRDYWDIYLEYLKHQWLAPRTKSEIIDKPADIREKIYDSRVRINTEIIDNKAVLKDFSDNNQKIMDYYFYRCMYENDDTSFISGINDIFEWESMTFNNVSVSNSLYDRLISRKEKNTTAQDDKIKTVNLNTSSGRENIKADNELFEQNNIPNDNADGQKKKSSLTIPITIILTIITIIILVMIAISVSKSKKNREIRADNTEESVQEIKNSIT